MGQCDTLIRTVGKRSPVLGYNHNFKHRGLIFHVQTEDSGVDNPHLFTHLFHGGVIISSRRMDYDADSEVDIVKSLMQSQHKAVLKDLKIGTFDDKIDLYLGSNAELEPRKDGDVAGPPSIAPTGRVRLDATIADLGPPASMPALRKSDASSGDTEDISGTAAAAAAAYQQQSAALAQNSAPSAAPESRQPAQPPEMLPSPAIHLDIPSTNHARPRVPTPLATQAISSDHQLGDPMVTFAPPKAATQRIPPQAPPIPQRAGAPQRAAPHRPAVAPLGQSIPMPIDELGESSGAYSMRRARPPTAEQNRSQRPAPPRTRHEPTPAKSFPRASGKAANPQPGRPRSSVVVSRPAVIIGAPPNVVGDKGKQRAPAARKARDGNLFGKDLISEKSLDEVIMAYLSEDSSSSDD